MTHLRHNNIRHRIHDDGSISRAPLQFRLPAFLTHGAFSKQHKMIVGKDHTCYFVPRTLLCERQSRGLLRPRPNHFEHSGRPFTGVVVGRQDARSRLGQAVYRLWFWQKGGDKSTAIDVAVLRALTRKEQKKGLLAVIESHKRWREHTKGSSLLWVFHPLTITHSWPVVRRFQSASPP